MENGTKMERKWSVEYLHYAPPHLRKHLLNFLVYSGFYTVAEE